ncbi:Rv3235 family protein [Auraticoccus monumenti]|uniref:Uncharacterized protein n=1 Tax=Auraticoccus monumenti TaxID=675864 RepID=A0A1G7E1F8_9ACTN|nr:Rv3235 family protein [Auraticoccus monumenti]SDE57548.1 hypothetical protein SAMN04489747_3791 [Auraticoccus monumenti]
MTTATATVPGTLRADPLPPQHPPVLELLREGRLLPDQPTLFAATTPPDHPPGGPDAPLLPDAVATAGALVRLVLESLAGRRPATQLSRWFSEDVLAELSVLRGLRRRSRRHPELVLHSLRVQHPHPAVAEVSVHLRGRDRSLAWALRLEATSQRWWCTGLELGPRPVR